MSEFDCNLSGAYVRLQNARQRLSAFLEQKGEDVVAQMYQGPKTWCDARAKEEFVINYVAEQQAVYETKKEKIPPKSAIKRWKRKARTLWQEQEIETAA